MVSNNRLNQLLFSFLLTIVLSACSDQVSETIIISQSGFEEKEADLHHLVKEVRYIPLDIEIPLQFITNVTGMGDKLLITSKDNLHLFGSNGEYLKKIGAQGRGPQEYVSINDVCVDIESNRIFVLARKKLLVYDKDGNYLDTFIPDETEGFRRVIFHKGMLYLFDSFSFGTLKYNWIVLDADGKRISVRKNYILDHESAMVTYINMAFENNNKLYYWNYLNDTIFELNGLKTKTAFLFAKDDARITTEDVKDMNTYFSIDKWHPTSIISLSDYLIFSYTIMQRPMRRVSAWYNTKTQEPLAVSIQPNSSIGIGNLLQGNLNFYPRARVTFDGTDYLVGWEDALGFKNKVIGDESENKVPDEKFKSSQQYRTAMDINEEDNPIIILVSLN